MAKANMGVVILAFVVIVVGLALTPTIGNQTAAAYANENITGVAATLVDLVPMFWAIFIIAIPVVAVYEQFKGMQG